MNTRPNLSEKSASHKSKIHDYILKKIFTEDNAYAVGEYEKNQPEVIYNGNDKEPPSDKRETWTGKFDVII